MGAEGPYTMFVPQNEAFDRGRIPEAQLSKLKSSRKSSTTQKEISNQFAYHIGECLKVRRYLGIVQYSIWYLKS